MFGQYIVGICGTILFVSLINGLPSDKYDEQCFNNHCSNSGVCLIVDQTRQCYCLPEWEGEYCHLKRTNMKIKFNQLRTQLRNTPCSYVPDLCKNSGVCYFDEDTKKIACQCPYPYDGTRCDEYSVCFNYCFNGGVCTTTGTGAAKTATCECKGDFEGDRCSVKVTTTAPPTTTTTTGTTTTDVICTFLPDGYCNTGACVVSGGRAICQCPTTHTGEQCQIPTGVTPGPGQTNPPINPGLTNSPINPGLTNPPINPGITTRPTGGRKCSDKPCRNNRPCYNDGSSYFCDCGTQFIGTDCETFIQG